MKKLWDVLSTAVLFVFCLGIVFISAPALIRDDEERGW